ncbi:hypothetical protein M422DRAFT_247300 [Sphaerobolus stellatus SS14]|nr:hypothetical protein M422DRAFT_247300 [Sphaerobolus stellatus SS14]
MDTVREKEIQFLETCRTFSTIDKINYEHKYCPRWILQGYKELITRYAPLTQNEGRVYDAMRLTKAREMYLKGNQEQQSRGSISIIQTVFSEEKGPFEIIDREKKENDKHIRPGFSTTVALPALPPTLAFPPILVPAAAVLVATGTSSHNPSTANPGNTLERTIHYVHVVGETGFMRDVGRRRFKGEVGVGMSIEGWGDDETPGED